MTNLVIACLSQKGGAGKSTMARLIARTYAAGGWDVKIADFNLKQQTSTVWAAIRLRQDPSLPVVRSEPCNSVKSFQRDSADLIVADGKPDSDKSSLEIAQAATLCVVPSGVAGDDLRAQISFARELVDKGIPRNRIIMVLNNISFTQNMVDDARQMIVENGFRCAKVELPSKTNYAAAQNTGRALSECNYKPLADRADEMAAEIVAMINTLENLAA